MKNIPLFLLALYSFTASAQKIKLSSPNKNIAFSYVNNNAGAGYTLNYKNNPVITHGAWGLDFKEGGAFKTGLKTGKPVYNKGVESYTLMTGKASNIGDAYEEVIIPLEEKAAPFRKINIQVRLFNDGMAFRYVLPLQKDQTSFLLTDEQSTFSFAGDPQMLALLLPSYTSSHEGEYTNLPLSAVKEDSLMDMPALFTVSGKIYVAITEAALLDYAGMYLVKHNGALTSSLSPLPSMPGVKVKANFPHQSPWRVIMVSDRIGALEESTILTSLNAPCKIQDASWLHPGKTTFTWWNGNVVPDSSFAPGNNFETNKYYIDFCARNGIRYHSVIEYGLHQWYVDDGIGFQPGPHSDVTKAVPGLDMKEICDYAKKLGVEVRVWVHWAALYPKLDSAFATFEGWGLSGIMIDFMDRDDQEMVNMQTEMLEKAAQHKLHVQFHGAYKPTGLSRTYPNEFTREGTLNYEVNKWDKRITPDHDLNIAFTRLLAGSTDYHLGGFRAVPDSLFKIQYTRPLMLGTRCHMLAMYVVLENPLGMVCDYPAAYEGEPGFDFLKAVPTTWDETKIPAAVVGSYLVTARRKGQDWFVGAINNHEAKTIQVPLQFLPAGIFDITIYKDAGDTHIHPNNLVVQHVIVTEKDFLNIAVAAGGGMVVHISPVK
ncbi:MAG: glycoside hydrolase family 97 protein [Agriterribacter sp.]